MISRIRERFGTAGLIVSVIALVAALAGGAYAASGGLNSKQKKEVKAIAKSFQGTGPAGAAGPAGPAGANGKDGTNGTNGANGAPGAAGATGADGTSVTGTALAPGEGPPGEECAEGGVEYTSASGVDVVCNGEKGPQGDVGPTGDEGSPWTLGGTLPSEKTETGAWAATGEGGVPVSFAIPLASGLGVSEVHKFSDADFATFCPGSAANPQAGAGNLCVYKGATFAGGTVAAIFTTSAVGFSEEGASKSGAVLYVVGGGGWGSWAVTAP